MIMADEGLKLFGWEIKKASRKDEKLLPSIVPPVDEDGAGYVTSAGAHYGTYVDINGDNDLKDDISLIRQYRGVSQHPEVDDAIENIVNEAISSSSNEQSIALILDKVEAPDSIKKQIIEEFDNVFSMLNFNELGHDIFKRWYIDGRMYHHLVVDEKNLKAGIQEIRPIDALKIRKVKQIEKAKDPLTGVAIIKKVEEFFIYQDKPGNQQSGVKLSVDSVSYVTSGLLDDNRRKVVSHLNKALKPINQLRMMEDSLVIYRLARAPERRIFYIDVGNLPKGKAEEYMKNIMSRYRNKLVYDANTGAIKDDRKHMSMLEDFWLPRREGGRGTQIETLPGGANLGDIEDIIYFQKRLFRSLNVPVARLEQETQFSLGRSTEISRDEVKFQKFIDRVRTRFSHIFYNILKKQLLIKQIITEEDWEEWKSDIVVDYVKDNHFAELQEAEMLRDRLGSLDQMAQYIGQYFSKEWVMKNVLQFDDDDIKQMKKEIEAEKAAGEYDDMMGMGQDGPGGPGPQDQQPPANAGAPGAITGNPSEPVEAAIPKKAKSNNGVKK
jgi:hypothetical protein